MSERTASSVSRNKGVLTLLLTTAMIFAFGFFTRKAGFGDLSYFNDEYFYWDVGLRMKQGALPYVDVWDRKGPGLFWLYYAITLISPSVLAFQIIAWLAASATALVLALLLRDMLGATARATEARFENTAAGVLTGGLYLAMLPMFGGMGGQTPVFYNLFTVLAAWLIWRELGAGADAGRAPRLAGLHGAMMLAGAALCFKFSALPECAFLGLWTLGRLRARGAEWRWLGRLSLTLALAGAAPMLGFALYYVVLGHFAAFWQAMITSNLTRGYFTWRDDLSRISALIQSVSPGLGIALLGLACPAPRWANSQRWRQVKVFAGIWLGVAVISFSLPPNFYWFYVLPLLAPIALCAGLFVRRGILGLAAAQVTIIIFLIISSALDSERPAKASAAIEGIASLIRTRAPHPRLLIYHGPLVLYGLLGSYPPSPLLDDWHLYFPWEDNVSGMDTAREVARDLAWAPNVVITNRNQSEGAENPRTLALIHGYVRHCHLWRQVAYRNPLQRLEYDIWGDCHRPGS